MERRLVECPRMPILNLIKCMRPRQWTKNLILFAGLLFSEKGLLFQPAAWLWATVGFFLFCLLSGAVYLINDLVDVERDRRHPEKRLRPIPAGLVTVGQARLAIFLLLVTTIGCAAAISNLFAVSAVAYFLLNLAYSLKLKQLVLLDVLCIAIGFVLRAQAGVGVLRPIEPGIYMSHWLLLCTLMLALFLALAKRRQEIMLLSEGADLHRVSLADYTPGFIDQMIAIVSATTVVSYALYTVSTETVAKFGTDGLVLTVPVVVYGIFRYLYLIHLRKLGDNPSELLLADHPLQITILIWAAAVALIIHSKGLISLSGH
ncbi:MAG TPA: decaprenyl-phosphate phosphoribosyltransferase [Candidatus Ozemobacteraceae bacterium]|nr:decaprenyl-phosphate phosphoribosyltransferase [Candidatus Ozemobacteraceae bacterium]